MLADAHARDAFVRSIKLALHRSPVENPKVLDVLQHLTLVRVKSRGLRFLRNDESSIASSHVNILNTKIDQPHREINVKTNISCCHVLRDFVSICICQGLASRAQRLYAVGALRIRIGLG